MVVVFTDMKGNTELRAHKATLMLKENEVQSLQ